MAMGRPGRVVIPLLGAFTGVALVVAGLAITLQIKERNLRLTKERELVLLKAEKEELEQRVATLKTDKQQLEEQTTRMKAELDERTIELAQERQAKEQLARGVEDRQREIDRIAKDLEQIRSEKDGVAKQLADLDTQQKSLKRQLAQAEKDKQELEARQVAQAADSSVNLDTVVVQGSADLDMGTIPITASGPSPDTYAAMPSAGDGAAGLTAMPSGPGAGLATAAAGAPVQGQVVVVNREYDFVVMNLGRNHGLAIGQEFQVLRGQEVLGRVKVEKVYDELAAASILPDSKKDAIREGDLLKSI